MLLGLPGQTQTIADTHSRWGTICDFCSEGVVTVCLQGETDSFGAEYHYLCRPCVDKTLAEMRMLAADRKCDWCGKQNGPTRPTRDVDEGMNGPVYEVCSTCRAKQYEAIQEELRTYGPGWPD